MRDLPSFIKDTTEFIRLIENTPLPDKCILASTDVPSLYTNISHHEGKQAAMEALNSVENPDPRQPPAEVIIELTDIVLKNNASIRPIVSGCSRPTEKISEFLDHHLKPLIPQLPSYTRDSGNIVSILETTPFPKDCILVAIDVSNLYLNIQQDEGTAVCLDALQDHDLLPMPRELLQNLFYIVLKCNVFSFSTHTF